MSSSAINAQLFQAKIGSIQNQADSSGVYSAGVWSFKNSTALTSVTITDAGNVGIGVTSPLRPLDILQKGNDTTPAILLRGHTTGADGARTAVISTVSSDANNWANLQINAQQHIWTYQGTERMRIDASGNLLVGTTSASHDTITNGFAFVGTASISALGIGHITGSGSGTNYISFNYAGAKIGSITQSGTGNVAFNTGPSDYRLKEQVQNLSEGLNKIKALRPVSFVWKADQRQDIGFIAHEIQSVIPECASGEKDAVDADGNPLYQSIFPAPAQMIASLVAAIQELSAKVDAQAEEIKALKAQP